MWIVSHHTYNKTFENKQYHLYFNCIRARNLHFDPSKVNIQCTLEGNKIHLQKKGTISCVKGTLHASYFLEFGNDSQGALNIIHAVRVYASLCVRVCVLRSGW